MRYVFAGGLSLACLLASLALGEDQAKKKQDLVYHWDQLDKKTAVYDAEVATKTLVEVKNTTKVERLKNEEIPDPEGSKSEVMATTKSRVTMRFKKGERDRGLVTVTVERVQFSLSEPTLSTQTINYDSDKPDAPLDDKIRKAIQPQIDALTGNIGRSYVLTVSRRGVVEKVEGRKETAELKDTFVFFPDIARAESDSWTQLRRQRAETPDGTTCLGDIKIKRTLTLRSVNAKGDRRIDVSTATELDTSTSTLGTGTSARIDDPVGKGYVVVDSRGLKLEEDTDAGYELVVANLGKGVEQHTKLLFTFRWKLVELKDAN